MKALIKDDEVITEPFPQWVEEHMDWMTGKATDTEGNPIRGGGYTLIEDYIPPVDPEPLTAAEPTEERHVL